MDKELELKCPICGTQAFLTTTNIVHKGCTIKLWMLECVHEEDEEPFPYVEHRLTIYGNTMDDAIERWSTLSNKIVNPPDNP